MACAGAADAERALGAQLAARSAVRRSAALQRLQQAVASARPRRVIPSTFVFSGCLITHAGSKTLAG